MAVLASLGWFLSGVLAANLIGLYPPHWGGAGEDGAPVSASMRSLLAAGGWSPQQWHGHKRGMAGSRAWPQHTQHAQQRGRAQPQWASHRGRAQPWAAAAQQRIHRGPGTPRPFQSATAQPNRRPATAEPRVPRPPAANCTMLRGGRGGTFQGNCTTPRGVTWRPIYHVVGTGDPRPASFRAAEVDQDKWVLEMLGGEKRGGYFVDLAAADAYQGSNTLRLEEEHGWEGICIEPIEGYHFNLAHRACLAFSAVVGAEPDAQVTFNLNGGLSGIVGAAMDNKKALPGKSRTYRTVSLDDILDAAGAPKVIDYLSLDVEGAEELALAGFPFSRYIFLTITIERPSKNLRTALEENGYEYVRSNGDFGDLLYVHNSLPGAAGLVAKHRVRGLCEERFSREWAHFEC